MRIAPRLALAAALAAAACGTPSAPVKPPDDALPQRSTGAHGDFLAPNAEDVDGAPAYVHYTPEDMPLRVNVQLPKLPARYASREQTDAAVIEAIKSWETAIQPVLPWFALEIVRDDKDAQIQVEWKTRITGDAAGWGGIGWEITGGRLRARGSFVYATKPCLEVGCQLALDELKLLVTHEFGHTLGLRHCLSCDSAMNYSFETQRRIFITETDVRTVRALYEIPNGTREDGTRMIPLRPRSAQ
jgi:predicted Zn-dependent protease